jgi:NAD(P)-dependent dehydrogenase (short-subunit alcohol dehydrogenase family)
MKILVTGAAGFIGMHTSQVLLARGDQVVGIDNLNDYYDVQLKLDRQARLTPHANFRFVKLDVADRVGMEKVTDRTYGVEKVTIMLGNPQAVNALLDTLVLDSKHFLWLRPGIPDDQPIAAGQKVLVVEATVDSVDLRGVSTSDGDEFAAEVSFSVVDRTQLFGTVAA